MQPQQPHTGAGPSPTEPYPLSPFPTAPNQGQQYAAAPYRGEQYPAPPYRSVQHPTAAGFGQSPASIAHWALPTGRSWQSIAAGYVALFAIVAWFLGPVALGLGAWALVRASRDGSHGRGRAVFAVVVGVLASVLLVAVLATA